MARKQVEEELQAAEVRYRHMLDRRDALNEEAAAFREERDRINAKKAEIREPLQALREEHAAVVAEVKAHKARRNELQARAKELIEVKRKVRGRLRGGLASEVGRLRDRVARLEHTQQTGALTLEEENRLLEELREARESLAELEALQAEHRDVLAQVDELGAAIDDCFKQADAEHEAVVAKSDASQSLWDRMAEKRETLDVLQAESDRLHQAFLEVRERADHYHRRAVEMREKVVAIRQARRQEDAEARALMEAQREAVQEALEDDEAWDEAVDEALAHLRKGGRLEL